MTRPRAAPASFVLLALLAAAPATAAAAAPAEGKGKGKPAGKTATDKAGALATEKARKLAASAAEEVAAGRFAEGVTRYELAYDIDPNPSYLLPLAEAAEKAGNPAKALFYYKAFLAAAPPGDPGRAAAEAGAERTKGSESTGPSAGGGRDGLARPKPGPRDGLPGSGDDGGPRRGTSGKPPLPTDLPSLVAEGDRLLRVFHDEGILAAAEWARAAELFVHAAELEPSNPEWVAKRAVSEAGLMGAAGVELEERTTRLAVAAKLVPGWAVPAYALCQALADGGDGAKALEACARAEGIEPAWALPAVTSGFVLREKGDWAGALAAYARASALDPRSGWSRYQQCYVLVRLERYGEAVARCEEAVALDPGLWGAYLSLALAHHREGRALEAGVAYKRAVLANPFSLEAVRDACFVTVELGESHDAILLCRRGLELAKDDPGLLEALGDAHYAAGEPVDALHSYTRALELDPRGLAINRAHVRARIAKLESEWKP